MAKQEELLPCILNTQCNACSLRDHICRHAVAVLSSHGLEPPVQDKIVAGTEGWSITELEELHVLLIRQVQLPTVRCLFCCDPSYCQRACCLH